MKKHFFVVAAIISSSQLLAQQAPQQQNDSTSRLLDEAVVTANKYANKTSLTGKVVTIITKEQLEKSGGRDLLQVLTEQAGIYIGGANSNAGKDKSLYLRGARIDHTLITIDGIPVYDASGIGGNFDLRNLSVANIERIEILKGSQSTLYGSDAIAGVINIITKKNEVKSINGNTTASYGSNETFRLNAGVNGKKGSIDYNLAYSLHTTKGINEATDNRTFPITDKDKFQQHNVQLGLGIKPIEKVYIQPFFRYNDINGDIDQGAFTDELDFTYSQKNWHAGLRNEFSFGKTKLTAIYSYNNLHRSFTDDSLKSRNGFDTYSHGVYKGKDQFVDVYAEIKLSKIARLTAGGDLRYTSTDQLYSAVPAWSAPFPINKKMNQQSVYSAININLESGFNAEAGGRINFHSEYGSHAVFNFNPSFLVSNKVKLFANFSSAYRTPTLYQLYSEYGNTQLKPEAAITTEGGFQYYSPGNKFTGRATFFSRNVKDLIFFFYNSSTFTSMYINQDKQKDHGFELEATYKPSKIVTLKTFYTYVSGEITTKKGLKDTTYNNLIRRPKSSFGLNAGIQATKKLFISTNLMAAGKRRDAYFDNATFTTVNVTLKSYVLLDLYCEYGFLHNRLKLFADVRNITNTQYNEIIGYNTLGFNGYSGLRFNF